MEIEPATPAPREEQELKVEMDRLIKSLPERKRRTFLRFMKKGKKTEDDDADKEVTAEAEPTTAVPHSRADLLQKIEALRLSENDELVDSDSDQNDECSDDDDEDDDGDNC